MPTWELDADNRWTRFTEDNISAILSFIRMGNFPTTAAAAVGISAGTFKKWRDKGREEYEAGEPTDYAFFYAQLLIAESDCERRFVSPVLEAAESGDAKIAMAFLERRFPSRWGPKARQESEVESRTSNRVKIEATYTRDEMSQVLSALANAGKLLITTEAPLPEDMDELPEGGAGEYSEPLSGTEDDEYDYRDDREETYFR